MTDYFALLEEPRRPWLDPEQVKETFHRLSRTCHPDQNLDSATPTAPGDATTAFATLNVAQQVLRDPKSRLRHLLSLEHPGTEVSGPSVVPPALADIMFPTQSLLGKMDALIARQAAAPGALARALLASEGFVLQEEAEERLATLEEKLSTLTAELRQFDARHWDSRPPAAADILLGFYHAFAYLGRWIEQFRERLFQLAS